MLLIFAHVALAIALFFLTNWIGKRSIYAGYIQMSVLVKADEAPAFNFIYRAFSPIVYIIIISAILHKTAQTWATQDIYWVVVYYFIIRTVFNILTGRARLLNWRMQIAYCLVSVPIAYYVYNLLIAHQEFLFPSATKISEAFWLAIIVFIYHTVNSIRTSDDRSKRRKINYITHRYNHYRRLFGGRLSDIVEDRHQEALTYAILIYEAFNRPTLYRLIENMLFYLGKSKTLGIMQVTTDKMITDAESIVLGAQKIVSDYKVATLQVKAENANRNNQSLHAYLIRRKVIALYNPDNEYIHEVLQLHGIIVDLFYADLKDN